MSHIDSSAFLSNVDAILKEMDVELHSDITLSSTAQELALNSIQTMLLIAQVEKQMNVKIDFNKVPVLTNFKILDLWNAATTSRG